jgi:hypothetical protein
MLCVKNAALFPGGGFYGIFADFVFTFSPTCFVQND